MKLHLPSTHLYVIAFSHKKLPLSLIGKLYLHLEDISNYKNQLHQIKQYFNAQEIIHLSTCNRSEFYLVSQYPITKEQVQTFFTEFYNHLSGDEKRKLSEKLILKKDETAVRYLMEVASSLQSMVVGEREIITQVRNAYETCKSLQLTGDFLRLVMKKVIETSKYIFTHTDIAKNPVSVASLASRHLKTRTIPPNARITLIGAGITMHTFMKYFHQESYQYTFVSRKKEKSQALQQKYGGTSLSLEELISRPFLPTDVLIVCTSSPNPIVDASLFKKLFPSHRKPIVVDLSNPSDISSEVFQQFTLDYIGLSSLKKQAQENLTKRRQSVLEAKKIIDEHLKEFLQIFYERTIENSIREIPAEFKEYKQRALNKIFRKKLQTLEPEKQQIIQEIVDYMEEKYKAVTYKKLKDLLLQRI